MKKSTLRKKTPIRSVNEKISMYRKTCEGPYSLRKISAKKLIISFSYCREFTQKFLKKNTKRTKWIYLM